MFFVSLVVSVMALIAAVHVLQVESYSPGAVERTGLGALFTVLPSTAGVAFILVGNLGAMEALRYQVLSDLCPAAQYLLLLGWVAATVGLFVLGIVTLVVPVLPWWAGLALVARNPFVAPFLELLLGVHWALPGYAAFRAGSHISEQSSGVR